MPEFNDGGGHVSSRISLHHAGYGSFTSSAMLEGSRSDDIMLTLYSYPELFGVADNNGYGLKVFAFLRLAGVPFRHEHIFDASSAPRGQLPTSSMTERRSATVTPSSPTSSLSTG